MEDFYLTLSEVKHPNIYYFFAVRCSDGNITFHDTTFDRENEDDRYYGLILDRAASDRLISLLSEEGNLQEVLLKKFGGISTLLPVKKYLEKNHITFEPTSDKFKLGA